MTNNILLEYKFNPKKIAKFSKAYNKIKKTDYFDEEFYKNTYDIKGDGLSHYLTTGYKNGYYPSLKFDGNLYLEMNPDVKQSGVNPLVHYIYHGKDENRVIKEVPIDSRKDEICRTNLTLLHNFKFEVEPLVSIIILNRNGLTHLKRLFKDFAKKTNYSNYEIIVVDNASCDESVEYLYSLKEELPIKVIENTKNESFSKGNNDAVKIANGEFVLLLNNDIEPTFGWLNEMVRVILSDDKIGAVGAKLVFPYYEDIQSQAKSFSIQHAGVKFREEITPYVYGPYHDNMYLTLLFSDKVNHLKEVISNTAACLLVPKKIYLEVNGLDENYFYGYEDIDFALKLIEKGYKSIYCPQALLFHHESATRSEDDATAQINYKNIMYFKNKWKGKFDKAILIDKLYNYKFITDKTLSFVIINEDNLNNSFINEVAKYLNDKGYNVNLIEDVNNKIIGPFHDILISFSEDYDVKELYSRDNLIKIIVSEDNHENYDLILNKSNLTPVEFADSLLKDIEDYYV